MALKSCISIFKTSLVHALIFFVCYCNIAVIFNYPLSLISPSLRLPIFREAYDLFLIFGVFSSYETINRDVELIGIRINNAENGNIQRIKLTTEEFFPYSVGEIQTRTWVNKHGHYWGTPGRQMALASLARKIRERYNRDHPAEQIQKVEIAQLTWPRSFESYEKLRNEKTIQRSVLYTD